MWIQSATNVEKEEDTLKNIIKENIGDNTNLQCMDQWKKKNLCGQRWANQFL